MASIPSAQFSLTLRVVLDRRPGALAAVANAIGDAGGSIGAVDIIEQREHETVRELTVDAADAEHWERIVAAVDTRRREGGETVRFPYSHEFEWTQPFPGDEAETYGWLYVRNARSPLPFLSDVQSLPNVVFVFHNTLEPLACRRRRAGSRPLPRPPVPGRPLSGFFARVCDPDAARSALRDWGVMRPLTVSDAEQAGITAYPSFVP